VSHSCSVAIPYAVEKFAFKMYVDKRVLNFPVSWKPLNVQDVFGSVVFHCFKLMAKGYERYF